MKLGIYYMDQVYYDDFEGRCENNCDLQVMKYYGIKHPELYLNAAPNLHLFESDENVTGFDVRFNEERLVPDYQKKLHAGIVDGKKAEVIAHEIRDKIKAGLPVMVTVDIFYLPYNPHYQIYNALHCIILSDDSAASSEIPVIDWYQWKYKGTVPQELFYEARNSLCPNGESPYSGRPAGNEWSWLDPSDWRGEAPELLRATVSNAISQFYEGEQISTDGNYYGIAAMKKIAEVLRERKEDKQENRVFMVAELRKAFELLYTRHKMFRHYIGESSQSIALPLLTEVYQGLDQDMAAWGKTGSALLKFTVNPTEKGYEKIPERFTELIRMEEQRHEILARLSSML